MQAIGMVANVLGRRDVKLHTDFVVVEEQPLDMLHLGPVRAAAGTADADMLPALTARSDDAQILLVDRRRHNKATGHVVSEATGETDFHRG